MAFRTDGAGGPADLRRLPNALAGRRLGPAFGTMFDLRQPRLLRMILVRKICNPGSRPVQAFRGSCVLAHDAPKAGPSGLILHDEGAVIRAPGPPGRPRQC